MRLAKSTCARKKQFAFLVRHDKTKYEKIPAHTMIIESRISLVLKIEKIFADVIATILSTDHIKAALKNITAKTKTINTKQKKIERIKDIFFLAF